MEKIKMNKRWYSEEEIRTAISEVKQWEHHELSKDWEIELINKLFNAPDLNLRSSDKEYEVGQLINFKYKKNHFFITKITQ